MTSSRISRRTVLRGAGAVVALPWLEAMLPRRAAVEPALPARMAFLFMPNGVLGRDWTPRDEGQDHGFSPTLEPMRVHADQTFVLSGLRNVNSKGGDGHYAKMTVLLSGATARRTGGKDLRAGTTVDQFAAQRLGAATRLPSLELGIEPVSRVVDMGYSTVYGATMSWRSPTLPATKEIQPRRVFDRMFRAVRSDAGDQSVLDLVRDESAALRRRVGRADRARIDEYSDALRALEVRIARFGDGSAAAELDGVEPPAEDPGGFLEHVDVMLELIVLAFRTDTTRIVSFMFGNAVSSRDFSFLDGVAGGHHHFSHHENDAVKMAAYQRINRWFVERLARFCSELRAVPEGEGNLLDRSLVWFGSGIRDGNSHEPRDLPILLCGGQALRTADGRALRRGEHLASVDGTPLTNLYVTMLDLFGCPVASFGDSSAALDLYGGGPG